MDKSLEIGGRKEVALLDTYDKQYKMNEVLIIGVDHGYGNIKTAHTAFKTGISVSTTEPTINNNFVELNAKYYSMGEEHKKFESNKYTDEDFYVFTFAAVANEMEYRNISKAKIYLAVGVPLKWVKNQKENFKNYLTEKRYLTYKYKRKQYEVEIVGCEVLPQCYSAVAENLKDYTGENMVVDIGNGTINIMYLNNGRVSENKAWTEKYGVNQLYMKIKHNVLEKKEIMISDNIIDNFLIENQRDIDESISEIIIETVTEYVNKVMEKLKEYEYNDKLMKLHFMGGGSNLVKRYGKFNTEKTFFNTDIFANAKGFEYFCYMKLQK